MGKKVMRWIKRKNKRGDVTKNNTMSIMPLVSIGVMVLLSFLGGIVHSEDRPAQEVVEYHYTLVTVAKEEIGVVFKYNRGKELMNLIISPPPPKGDNASLTQDHVLIAEDGSRILLKVKWGHKEPRELENIHIKPESPRQPPVQGKTVEETYLLRTKEGAILNLTCTWSGSNIVSVLLERREKEPAKTE